MKTRGIFVTGTDTGVGKTFVTAGLLSMLRKSGIDAVPMKPVQTGCHGPARSRTAPDADFALRTADLKPSRRDYRLHCPYMFMTPCSPHLAARLEKRCISPPTIVKAFETLAGRHDFVVVEGAGGLLVPIHERYTMADLASQLRLPALLVARAGLGTINHTLLSVAELRRRRIPIQAIVVNQHVGGKTGGIEEDNVATIRRLSGVPCVLHVPFAGRTGKTMTPRQLRTCSTAMAELIPIIVGRQQA